jgi:Flp pilus assembly protein protease CpaA
MSNFVRVVHIVHNQSNLNASRIKTEEKMSQVALITLLPLLLLGAVIIWQDIQSLEIDSWIIYLFFASSLLLGATSPLSNLDMGAHLFSSGLAFGVALSIRLYFLKIRKIDGLGEADVWLIGAAGAITGPFLLGPWLFFASLLAVIFMFLPVKITGKRNHPDQEKVRNVLPLTPILIVTSTAFYIMARADINLLNYLTIM